MRFAHFAGQQSNRFADRIRHAQLFNLLVPPAGMHDLFGACVAADRLQPQCVPPHD